MTYTKAQLKARVQTLSEVLEAFDVAHFQRIGLTQQWALDYRTSLYNRLVAAREAEAEEDPLPYAPSEAYLNALRSFGLTDEDCVEELRRARDCDFELLLADEKRKAYDQGRADGKTVGYAEAYDEGKADGYEKGYEVGWCLGSSRS